MTPDYTNRALPVDKRVADLLGRLSVAEKVGQLALPLAWPAWERQNGTIVVSDTYRPWLGGDGLGMLYGVLRTDPWTGRTLATGLNPREGAEATNLLQRFAIENTRHGIPLLFVEECVQGVMALGSTVFPPGLTMGSTWNVGLMERVARAVHAEASCRGVTVALGPVLDLARDPRWSRVEESFGEDPFLAAQFGLAMLRGFQGGPRPMIGTLKHFAAHGEPEGGHNAAPAHVGPRELHEILLAPFRAAVSAGGAQAVMASYNEIDGRPCSGNRELLTDILRRQWGFAGIVMSDAYSVEGLVGHGLAGDVTEAAAVALQAGLESVMTDLAAFQKLRLVESVQAGKVRGEDLDEAVRRVLRLKFQLGVFEQPYVDAGVPAEVVGCREHIALSRQAAREGIVLLKNAGNILPLKKNLRSVAVIGPNADSVTHLFGHYVGALPVGKVKTVLAGIREAVTAGTEVRYARGCGIRDESQAGFAEAVQAATGADVAVVVVGGSSARAYGEEHAATGAAIVSVSAETECGEGHDRHELELTGAQPALLRALQATGTPLVVIYVAGRPLLMNWAAEHAAALLAAWYPGEQGGVAIADVLFGDYNPAGRLPVSVPKSVGQLPVYYNHKPSGRKPYVGADEKPRFAFGFGLSYTTFRYDNLQIAPGQVSVEVTNTGSRAGDEVVQLYVSDLHASTTRPVKELKGFCRVHLQPGETRRVSFELPAAQLQMLNTEMQWVVEPGEFKVMVGGNSGEGLTGTFTIRG